MIEELAIAVYKRSLSNGVNIDDSSGLKCNTLLFLSYQWHFWLKLAIVSGFYLLSPLKSTQPTLLGDSLLAKGLNRVEMIEIVLFSKIKIIISVREDVLSASFQHLSLRYILAK